jgi:hypothetical protein
MDLTRVSLAVDNENTGRANHEVIDVSADTGGTSGGTFEAAVPSVSTIWVLARLRQGGHAKQVTVGLPLVHPPAASFVEYRPREYRRIHGVLKIPELPQAVQRQLVMDWARAYPKEGQIAGVVPFGRT